MGSIHETQYNTSGGKWGEIVGVAINTTKQYYNAKEEKIVEKILNVVAFIKNNCSNSLNEQILFRVSVPPVSKYWKYFKYVLSS